MENISSILFSDRDFARWQYPWTIWLLVFVFAFIVLFVVNRVVQKRILFKIATNSALKSLIPDLSKNRAVLKFFLWTLGLTFIILNLEIKRKKSHGLE